MQKVQDCSESIVGASLLAINEQATRGVRLPALSLSTIASRLAPTRVSGRLSKIFPSPARFC
jgi:hypothetical protein